ncbi:MAG: LacI family DNA-binding transcriptional regulator [Terracidiphilus sp.]|jgi:LacI family transcriptional regulator
MAIRKSQAPTLADVAREARVSLKTASRVLNKSENVRQEKVARVEQVMARLGYRPNELARSLMTRKSSAIGMIVANLSNPFIVSVIKDVQEVARTNGYVVIVTSSGGLADVERSEIEILVRRQIDGLIIAPTNTQRDTFSDALPAGLPVVTFDQRISGSPFDSVTITNRRSAREATQHMLGHGLSRIVAVGTRPHQYTSRERVIGYREAMRKASLEPMVCAVDHEGLLTAEWLDEEVLRRNAADAIFALNWVSTLHVLRGLYKLGMQGGRDIPFMSFDDFDLGDVLTPRLSVVQQPSEMLGRECARLLFERLNGGAGKRPCLVAVPARRSSIHFKTRHSRRSSASPMFCRA